MTQAVLAYIRQNGAPENILAMVAALDAAGGTLKPTGRGRVYSETTIRAALRRFGITGQKRKGQKTP